MNIIEKILYLEAKNDNFTKYKVYNDDFLIWSFIRFHFIMDVINKEKKLEIAHGINKTKSLKQIIKYIFYTLKYNPYHVKENDILVFGHGVSNIKKENIYFNKVNEYFVDFLRENTNYIEGSKSLTYFHPKIEKNFYCWNLIKLKIKIKSKIFRKTNRRDIEIISKFIEKLKIIFGENFLNYDYYQKKIIDILNKIPHFINEYEKILKKAKPKIVFIEDGSYGGENSILIIIAKKMKIKVGEFQHGYVCKTHHAYNYIFKNEICKKEYIKTLPDFYLTYGKYWSENIRTLSKVIDIGNPHFEKMYEKYKKIKSNYRHKTILIISQGTVTKKMVDFTIALNNLIDKSKYKIIFRLHPGEISFVERYEILKKKNIELSDSGDIYDLIAKSSILVGSSSTALFEAKAFNKDIYILNNSDSELLVSKNFGIWINNVEEFIDTLNSNKSDQNSNVKDYYWKDNWESNYRKFLQEEAGII